MSKAIALLWLGTQAAQAAHEADLEAYAHAHLVRFEAASTWSGAGTTRTRAGYDAALVGRIEELLEQARIGAASLDSPTASARGAEVEELLRAHPELPQAAWLMAERWHIAAALRAPVSPAEAEGFERRATALEGPRATAYGSGRVAPTHAPAVVAISISGPRATDQLYWDGRKSDRELETAAGEHHVRVLRKGRVAFADWITLDAKTTTLRLSVPAPMACSNDDLAGTKIVGDRAQAPPEVQCGRWAVARPAAQGGVEIASCRGSSCGLVFVWHRRMGATYEGPPQPRAERGFPTWATYALLGAGAAAVTGVVLWQSGVFDEPERGRTRFRFEGPR